MAELPRRTRNPVDPDLDERREALREFIDEGLVWLVNTAVLHPRGWALAYEANADGTAIDQLHIKRFGEYMVFEPGLAEETGVLGRYEAAELAREAAGREPVTDEQAAIFVRLAELTGHPDPQSMFRAWDESAAGEAMSALAAVLDERALALEVGEGTPEDPMRLAGLEVGMAAGLTTAARIARQW